MRQEDLKNWSELEDALRQLEDERARAVASTGSIASRFLFRGHRDSSWDLTTTLERRVRRRLSISQYFRLVLTMKPQIETFTGLRWNMPDFPELQRWATSYDDVLSDQFPGYDYLAYLRHHGFPSPLLDWTASPFVASYFAFVRPVSERVAIYVFQEYVGGGREGGSDRAQILRFGPYVRAHPRHFLQQSQYTICCRYSDGVWSYAPHDEVFAAGSETQDRLWKYTLPSTEAANVLKRLDAYNLNALSLFQTEEALLETISFREIELREREF